MIKGINQSIINRSITGGVTCKCVNGGSSNGNGIDGGKITLEIPVYSLEVTGVQCIKKEDAERLFREILSIDLEKYIFYQIRAQHSEIKSESIIIDSFPCDYTYNQYLEDGAFIQYCSIINARGNTGFVIFRKNNTIDYDRSNIIGDRIVDTLPGTVEYEFAYQYTFYYRAY